MSPTTTRAARTRRKSAARFCEAAPGAVEIGDRREAIGAAIAELRRGDVLVIAGKGHETGQIVGGEVLPFDDAAVAREALDAPRRQSTGDDYSRRLSDQLR